MAFRRGAKEAEQAGARSGFDGVNFFGLADGESTVLRFLTDAEPDDKGNGGWLVVDQHNAIPTKPAPTEDGNWPKKMSAVCRYDQGVGAKDCYICDVMKPQNESIKNPSGRVWALAVVREEVEREGKRGFRDHKRKVERKVEGKTVEVEEWDIVVVNQGTKNFFSYLRGLAANFGTVCDQDFKITRQGAGMSDTTYIIIPLGQIPGADGEIYDVRKPEVAKKYEKDGVNVEDQLVAIVTERASSEFYRQWFIPGGDGGSGGNGSAGPTPQAPTNDVVAGGTAGVGAEADSDAALQNVRDRLRQGAEPYQPPGSEAPTSGAVNID